MAIRADGDWEGWLRFFLTGVAEVSREAEQTAQAIVQLREEARHRTQSADLSSNAFALLNCLFEQPVINVNSARDNLGLSYVAVNNMIGEFCEIGLLSEVTGLRRNRMFRFDPYLALFADVAEEPGAIAPGTAAVPVPPARIQARAQTGVQARAHTGGQTRLEALGHHD